MTIDIGRYAFALLPTEPLFSKITAASQRIADLYHNDNIIDRDQFPPHVSLHICTMPRTATERLKVGLRGGDGINLFPLLELTSVKKGSSGYVNLAVKRTPPLMALHEFVLELAVESRRDMDADPRPHMRSVTDRGRSRYDQYGNAYVLDSYDPHFSIAKVERRDVDGAHEIAVDVLCEIKHSQISALELCEIGMSNEMWKPIVAISPDTS